MGLSPKAKTIDFSWNVGSKYFYASHKYTKEDGGSQKNAFGELLIFIAEVNNSNNDNRYFIAIADGDYYKKKDKKTGALKLDLLKQEANSSKNVYAMTIEELEDFLNNISKE